MEHSSRSSTSTETIVYKGKDGDYAALITAVYSAARARDIESELAMTISKRMIELDYVFDKHTSVMMHLLGTPIAPIQPLLMDESEDGISASVLRTRKVENKALQAKYRFECLTSEEKLEQVDH